MNLVADASVIVKWYVDEIDTDAGRQLLLDGRFVFCVPAHAFGEVGNALATCVRRGVLSRGEIPEIGRELARRVKTYPIDSLLPAAVEIALDIRSTVYDAFYIALAAELDTFVVTADEKLARAASQFNLSSRVRLLGDVAAGF